ncbi:MAG: 4Fe-4S binding protein, partial [Actinomycetota bacterium]
MATTPEPTPPDLVGPPWSDRWTVRIDERCTACGNCLMTCPPRALARAPRKPLVIDARCTSCGACIEVCPVDAITEVPIAGVPTADTVAGIDL